METQASSVSLVFNNRHLQLLKSAVIRTMGKFSSFEVMEGDCPQHEFHELRKVHVLLEAIGMADKPVKVLTVSSTQFSLITIAVTATRISLLEGNAFLKAEFDELMVKLNVHHVCEC